MKKKLFSLAVMLMAWWAVAHAQITGSVKDASTGEPLFGANVILVGTRIGAVVGEEGRFAISNAPTGIHTLKVSYLGFATFTTEVQAPVSGLEFQLQPLAIFTEEFIVSSTRARETTPTTFQTITKEDLTTNHLGQALPFLLTLSPSVITHSDAGAGIGYTGMRIRGTDQTRSNVTVNGIPTNDAESHGVF